MTALAIAALAGSLHRPSAAETSDNAGIGRSSGEVPDTMAGMAKHVLAFLDGLGLESCDVLGFSLGGAIAQVIAQERPSIVQKMILVGTAPRGGEDVMHLEKPALAKYLADPTLRGYMIVSATSSTEWEPSSSITRATSTRRASTALPGDWPVSCRNARVD